MTKGLVYCMPVAQVEQDFMVFMEEYAEFLERMQKDEKEKLFALSARDLEKIEKSISVSQANAKRLENYESKRVAMQAQAGQAGVTFRDLVEQVSPDMREKYRRLFARFENSVQEIRFNNDKSMAVARDSMVLIDPDAMLSGAEDAKTQNPYQKIRDEQHNRQNQILEKNI